MAAAGPGHSAGVTLDGGIDRRDVRPSRAWFVVAALIAAGVVVAALLLAKVALAGLWSNASAVGQPVAEPITTNNYGLDLPNADSKAAVLHSARWVAPDVRIDPIPRDR